MTWHAARLLLRTVVASAVVVAALGPTGWAHAAPGSAPTTVTPLSGPTFTAFTPPTTGTVGIAYSGYTFAATGTEPISFTITSGALPTGLTMTSSGVLSGTPTTAGDWMFTVTATDSGSGPGSASISIIITISLPSAPTFTASTPPNTGAVGTAYAGYTFTASGTEAISFSVASGALPPGLSMTSGGVLAGTPTSLGAYSFTVDATNSIGSVSTSPITITVTEANTSADTAPAVGPAPWLQSYGRSGDEDCIEGWHPSWAEWATASTGGWVCNRTIFWHESSWMQSPSAVWGQVDPTQTRMWDGL